MDATNNDQAAGVCPEAQSCTKCGGSGLVELGRLGQHGYVPLGHGPCPACGGSRHDPRPAWERGTQHRDPRDQAVIELIIGLTTPTEGRKQHALEQALRALCEDGYVGRAKAHFRWQDGTAP
jgi:hypothetical protein